MYRNIIEIVVSLLICFGLTGCLEFLDQTYTIPAPVLKSASKRECKLKPPIGRIYFDCTIPDEHYEIVREDLIFLQSMKLEGTSGLELQRILHLPETTGEALFRWLEDHVQFVLDETFDEPVEPGLGGRNVSNPLIKFYRDPFAIVHVPGIGPVEINSQRIGVILLGRLFFTGEDTLSRRIDRISTLLHEARHNGGRGVSNGFPHTRCPKGHQEGEIKFACDSCTNGPHGISQHFLQSALESCLLCTESDRWSLRFYLKWEKEDILPSAVDCDDSLEFV